MFKILFGSKVAFVLWHAYVGGAISFVGCALLNNVHWVDFIRPIPAFWTVFFIGCLVGWFHHPENWEASGGKEKVKK